MVLHISNYDFKEIKKSTKPEKKWMAVFQNNKSGKIKNVHFGATGYLDFIGYYNKALLVDGMNHEQALKYATKFKERYLARHKEREDWTKTGIFNAGFWSKWILWGADIDILGNLKHIRTLFNF